jgi:hypothetical protein
LTPLDSPTQAKSEHSAQIEYGQTINLGASAAYVTQDVLTGFVVRGRFDLVSERQLVAATVPTFVSSTRISDSVKLPSQVVVTGQRNLGHSSLFLTF